MDKLATDLDKQKCCKCNVEKELELFRKFNNGNFSATCKKCYNELDKLRKKNKRKNKLENTIVQCQLCLTEKPLKEFAKLKKHYKKRICYVCYPAFVSKQKNLKEHNSNVNYRLKKSLALKMRSVLQKENTTMAYVGCNIPYLREWFEFNFAPEMTWDNYGSYWSIDHVIPVKWFDLTDEKEKYACWNWSNMMPTTNAFNSSKKSNIDVQQMNCIEERLKEFKEKGSTTKWFSEEWLKALSEKREAILHKI